MLHPDALTRKSAVAIGGKIVKGTASPLRLVRMFVLTTRIDPQRIAISSDHAGFDMKAVLVEWMRAQGHDVQDLGPDNTISVDYPDYGFKLAEVIASGDARFGVLVCGSGIGISIAANRHPAVRCAQVSENLSARLARSHNDANVISFGARLIGPDQARDCLSAFLAEPFLGDRHTARVDKLGHPHFAKEPS
jgi:ribose 5-phosphate isomerase B